MGSAFVVRHGRGDSLQYGTSLEPRLCIVNERRGFGSFAPCDYVPQGFYAGVQFVSGFFGQQRRDFF